MIRVSLRRIAPRSRGPTWVGLGLGMLLAALLVAHELRDRQRSMALLRADPNSILNDTRLRGTALIAGRPVYVARCAPCHGPAGEGDTRIGAPDFVQGHPLYGSGKIDDIEDIVRHGIRAPDARGRHLASMPAYATEHPYKGEPVPSLTPHEIEALTQYLLAYTHRATDPRAAAEGAAIFRDKAGCWDCHGWDATGDTAIGAPDLTDARWLYGDGSHDDIYRSISRGRAGFSPAFKTALSAIELRTVSVYVASLRRTSGTPRHE